MDMDGGDQMMPMDSNSFCMSGMGGMGSSSGTVMYMQGFRFALASDPSTPCLNLFFSSWTLNTRGKFVAAMIAVLLLSVITEGMSAFRLQMRKTLKPGKTRKFLVVIMHGMQALLGYLIMLATMTFSIEMLLMVVTGIGIGYSAFFDDTSVPHVTTNPCCAFMADEAAENETMEARALDITTETSSEGCCGEEKFD
uniref:Copper transport protein n=1 Tax=Helicotheca tamesis TaxID=374047 RepID=A0A7S2HDD7_9STRA|mmetsp:Transcript_17177/g.23598  ORF Transcript_17177/g.23598 Transcript_17177/m.23598 type:complete len:196 (+) Transcript_17177:168-755(+)|eukprot:CAMPEP_0185723512 /NCGR_PEP_ID=MMETSP1171-20130828/337_1 /TAXON_ID=374046 /ORGANISM="Helicotheca tamensis, Strain CCMP826" /LENGTH=195 /DNA_ID=CAMNT_0028391229 /DNA_START=148 /DNA_END=735 /DNA_ORIENTATION=+